MFFSGNYGEFLQSDVDLGPFTSGSLHANQISQMQYFSPPVLQPHYDPVYSQFTETIAKRLALLPYPSNFKQCNPFCPLCLRFVRNEDNFMTCLVSTERSYLLHCSCLQKDKGYQMRDLGEILQNSAVILDNQLHHVKNFALGHDSRNFYVEVCFSHPIHDRTFFKVSEKVTSVRNMVNLSFYEHNKDGYFPNIVAIPLTDFRLTVTIIEFGHKTNRSKFVHYVSLRNLKDKQKIKVQCQEVELAAEIIQDQNIQSKLIESMNYKYRFGSKEIPMLRISTISVKLPQEFEEESEEEDFIVGSSSNIVEDLLNEKEPSVLSTIKSSSLSPLKARSSSNSSGSMKCDSQRVNLESLISSDGLIDFVKNNTQSRIFQDYLQVCGETNIETIINHIQIHLVELIMHQYGNYMVQKLYIVSTPLQRIKIINIILPCLSQLVKNKQGTHTVQAFLSQFTTQQQFALIAYQLRQDYYELCCNNNATHFVQKVVKIFPLAFTIPYFSYTVDNLLAFALDKNAMCVIKHMMRRLRELEGREQDYYQQVEGVRRQLITHVTFGVDRLITDSYGNYVIQFCYELFDIEKCVGITERILSGFSYFAIGKFSSNVILKCISTYWTDKTVYQSLKALPSNQVVDIFRNKDGNKILLEIMEKLEGTELWDRLYSILIRLEPTRFYHDRWGVCLGSRSGNVGCKFQSFPDPRQQQRPRRKR